MLCLLWCRVQGQGWRKAVRLTAIQTEMNSSGSPDVIHPYGQNITKEILNLSPPTRQYSTAIPQAGLDPLMRQFWTPGRMFGNNFMVDPFLWIHQKGTLTIKSLCTLTSKNLIIITLIALFQDFSSSIRFSMGLRPPITPTTHYQDVHQLWPPPSRILQTSPLTSSSSSLCSHCSYFVVFLLLKHQWCYSLLWDIIQ